MSSVLDGPGEGTWSVFAQKVVAERDALVLERDSLRRDLAATHAEASKVACSVADRCARCSHAQSDHDASPRHRCGQCECGGWEEPASTSDLTALRSLSARGIRHATAWTAHEMTEALPVLCDEVERLRERLATLEATLPRLRAIEAAARAWLRGDGSALALSNAIDMVIR